MPDPSDPKREQPSTYVVQDRSNQEEMTRLQKQDQLMTANMGGVFAEQADPASLRRVLDIGCGTGGWLLETARTYPDIALLIGVDANQRMVQFAREQAEAQQLSDRVEFHVMDALRMLEFPDAFFDLVNVRSALSYLRTWDWPKFLEECRRVCRPGGVVRITEGDMEPQTTSPAMKRLFGLLSKALYQAGHFFTPDGDSVIQTLPSLFERFNLQHVQTRDYEIRTRRNMEEWQLGYDDARLLFRTIRPFLERWMRVPDDYQETYQQMLQEMQQPDFEAMTILRTVWGVRG